MKNVKISGGVKCVGHSENEMGYGVEKMPIKWDAIRILIRRVTSCLPSTVHVLVNSSKIMVKSLSRSKNGLMTDHPTEYLWKFPIRNRVATSIIISYTVKPNPL